MFRRSLWSHHDLFLEDVIFQIAKETLQELHIPTHHCHAAGRMLFQPARARGREMKSFCLTMIQTFPSIPLVQKCQQTLTTIQSQERNAPSPEPGANSYISAMTLPPPKPHCYNQEVPVVCSDLFGGCGTAPGRKPGEKHRGKPGDESLLAVCHGNVEAGPATTI